LARSQWPQTASAPAEVAPVAVADHGDDVWTGVYMRGEKVGYGHTRIVPAADGYRISDRSFLRLSVLDHVESIRAVTEATTGADFALRSFDVALDSGLGDFAVHGSVQDGTLALNVTSGGETTEQRLPLREPLYLPESARAHLRAAGLAPGRTATVRVFDPSAMEHQPLEMRVIGREAIMLDGASVDAWKVHESFRGMETTAWLDDDGRTLREEGPLGTIVQREDAARAASAGWGADPFDLMAAVAIHVARPIADPRHLARLRARLDGLGEAALPSDARQTMRAGALQVDREAAADSGTYTIPYAGEQWRQELEATPFLQSDHPRVRDAARTIVGDERDPARAAARLRAWVFGALEKRPTASIPNALQVLEMRAGDCNEHAVLFAALARAAGIPARVVAGIVYADGVFLYHAWDEVWIGSRWMSVDAAFDQAPVDATHIKLVEGGPETHGALVPLIGKLSVDVMDTSSGSAGA
jgi:hypothetical protein